MKLSPETCFYWPECCCKGECDDDCSRALLIVIASLAVWVIVFAALWLTIAAVQA